MSYLHEQIDYDVLIAPVAATSANTNGDSIDTQNFDGVEFEGVIGTAAAGGIATMAIQTGSSTTAFVALTGATASTTAAGSDGLLIIDINNAGGKRFLRPVLTNATTANIEYGGVVARRYRARTLPTTATSTGDLLAAKVYVTNPTTAT